MCKNSTIHGTVCNSRSVSDQTNGFKSPTGLTRTARPQRHKDRIERLYYTFISSHPHALRSSSPSAPWGTHMGCCTFANESRFLFEVFFPLLQTRKEGERGASERESDRARGAPAIALFFSAVFNPEEDKLCRTQRGSAIGLSGFTRSHSAFLQPSHTHTHTHARVLSITHSHAQKRPALLTVHAARRSVANDLSTLADLSLRKKCAARFMKIFLYVHQCWAICSLKE